MTKYKVYKIVQAGRLGSPPKLVNVRIPLKMPKAKPK